jgi:hypothetical protein
VTVSAGETRWTELLIILKVTVDKMYNFDVSDMEFSEKARLISSDPVTCASYFNHRFKELMKTWKHTKEGPFKGYKVKATYHRIEFQHRGSPHVHMILWLENAPVFDQNNQESYEKVENFIDEIITCSSSYPGVGNLIDLQRHKCTKTCWKYSGSKKICRFDAPFKPMNKTTILLPLTEDEKKIAKTKDESKVRNLNVSIREKLGNLPENIETFEEFLILLNCTLDEYIYAIRVNLKKSKIFLKRNPQDSRINAYAPKILCLMKSNMDIQFALDVYACIGYIVDYINKSNRGMSKLLKEAVEELKHSSHTVRQKLKHLGNVFINGTEVSAQEAAWRLLGLQMTYTSIVVEFVNTNPISKRKKILKSKTLLKKLDEESKDIYVVGKLERYAQRSELMEHFCYADFISEFEFKSLKPTAYDPDDEADDPNPPNLDDEEEDEREIADEPNLRTKFEYFDPKNPKLKIGEFRKRKTKKILRFINYSPLNDPDNFFREIILLFYPWRNETEDVENQNCQQIYLDNQEIIDETRKKYFATFVDFNEIIKQLEEFRDQEMARMRADEEKEIDQEDDEVQDEFVNTYAFDREERVTNVFAEMGMERVSDITVKKFSIPKLLKDEEFQRLISSQNEKQLAYFMHVMSNLKLGNTPFYEFVTGGAGVGKSHLIKAIFQGGSRHYYREVGPVEGIKILLLAPTGKKLFFFNYLKYF